MTTAINPVESDSNTDGDQVLHPVPADQGAALLQALEAFDDAFTDRLVSDQEAALPSQSAAPP